MSVQTWTITTRYEVVVEDDDGTLYGPYENEAIAREEWEEVTDYEWKIRPLHNKGE